MNTISDREVCDMLARAMGTEPNRKTVVPVGAKLLQNLQAQERSLGHVLATLLLPANRTRLETGDMTALRDLFEFAEREYESFKKLGGEWSLDECLSDGMKQEAERLNGRTWKHQSEPHELERRGE